MMPLGLQRSQQHVVPRGPDSRPAVPMPRAPAVAAGGTSVVGSERNANAQPPALGSETTEPRRPANYPRNGNLLIEKSGVLSHEMSSVQLPSPLSAGVATRTAAPSTAAAPESLSGLRSPLTTPPPNRTSGIGMQFTILQDIARNASASVADVITDVRESQSNFPNTAHNR